MRPRCLELNGVFIIRCLTVLRNEGNNAFQQTEAISTQLEIACNTALELLHQLRVVAIGF